VYADLWNIVKRRWTMSFTPAFEIGIWNAWVFMLFIFLCIILTVRIFKNDVGKKIAHGEEERKYSLFVAFSFLILLIYSIFLPMKLGTIWFYTGLTIYLLGLIICTVAVANVAATPLGEPFTKGVYHYSRNALSFGMLLIFLGIGVASASWVFLLITAVLTVITHLMIRVEERTCLKKFGDAYREYMKSTPRWIGIPKL
jgi:protein-S-isoprenylcysteine O-methyltransferase Ste14